MLSRLIVDVYGWIVEIFLWMALLIAGFAGFHGLVRILKNAGWVPDSEIAWKIIGAVISPFVAFLILAVLFGPILVLIDIRKSVRSLEAFARNNANGVGAQSIEYKEPHL